MLTIIFVILKLTHQVLLSWWWIIAAILLDEWVKDYYKSQGILEYRQEITRRMI